jgi:hypothetical protein
MRVEASQRLRRSSCRVITLSGEYFLSASVTLATPKPAEDKSIPPLEKSEIILTL